MATDYTTLFETIDKTLQSHNVSFDDLVIEALNAYGELYSAMASTNSMKEVDIIADENPEGLRVNANVQYLLELERRGIVQLLGDAERIDKLRHPILNYISKADVAALIGQETRTEEIHDIIATMVSAQAAKAVLGGVEYNVDLEWLSSHDINIVHLAHGTIQ